MTVAEVGELIEDVVVPVSPAGLREAIAVRDRLDARIAVAVGEFDAGGLGDEDCSLSTTSWLRHRAGLDDKAAAKLTMLGRRLHRFPTLRGAALDGSLTGGQLAVISACVPEKHFDRFAEHEAALVDDLIGLGVSGTRVLMRSWLAKADDAAAKAEPGDDEEPPSAFFHSQTLDGRGEVSASLTSDHSANLEAALRLADSDDLSVPAPQRRAEALDDVVRFFLDNHDDRDRKRRHRPHVNLSTSVEDFVAGLGLEVVETGQRLSRRESEVLRCDCNLHRVVLEGRSAILDYGRAMREWPTDLYNAIVLRDQGCRFPGCCRPASWCDVHHVLEWDADQGPTSIANGVMLCRRHHRRLHRRDGTHAKVLPDGTFEVTFRDGRFESTAPRGPVSPHLWDPPDERRPGDS